MHGQQVLPLFSSLSIQPLDAALEAFGSYGVTEPCPLHGPYDDHPETDEDWMNAAEAVESLDVTVRHLRKMATAGMIDRRRVDGVTQYRRRQDVLPVIGHETDESTSRTDPADLGGTQPRAAKSSRDTNAECAPDAVAQAAIDAAHGVQGELDLRGEEPVQLDTTVLLDTNDVVFLSDDVVPSELLHTNRELMRLVDGVLDRWTEAMNDKGESTRSLVEVMDRAMQLQQCLSLWQDHASQLQRNHIETRHVAARALDAADEALSQRWLGGGRRKALSTRVQRLRAQVGLG